jgi:hypothetical protein
VLRLLLDSDAGTLTVKKNGTLLGVAVTSGLTGDLCWAVACHSSSNSVRIKAGSGAGGVLIASSQPIATSKLTDAMLSCIHCIQSRVFLNERLRLTTHSLILNCYSLPLAAGSQGTLWLTGWPKVKHSPQELFRQTPLIKSCSVPFSM